MSNKLLGRKIVIVEEPWYMFGVVQESGRITSSQRGYTADHNKTISLIKEQYSGKEVIGPFFGGSSTDADRKYFAALEERGVNFWDTVFGTIPGTFQLYPELIQ